MSIQHITDEQAKKLREPFRPEQIGKLPKPTKKENEKGRCGECGGWHGLPAVHLDYVGHAAITDRLLQVDPEWSWRPMATNERGFPLRDDTGGLWIWLTVCGVTRPGYGDETNGKGTKEIIGDALRNGAMRFGVGLDLWSKEDLNGHDEDSGSAAGDTVVGGALSVDGSAPTPSQADAHGLQASRADNVGATSSGDASDKQKAMIRRLAKKLGLDAGNVDSLGKREASAKIEELLAAEAMTAEAVAVGGNPLDDPDVPF